ncbi:MAG: hypothetical protein OEZ34_14965 [Spirochaetia bacterium]|nr:hypothetical protein [Spirochaetia bacterium]
MYLRIVFLVIFFLSADCSDKEQITEQNESSQHTEKNNAAGAPDPDENSMHHEIANSYGFNWLEPDSSCMPITDRVVSKENFKDSCKKEMMSASFSSDQTKTVSFYKFLGVFR